MKNAFKFYTLVYYMFYNTRYVCSYQDSDVFIETDDITATEKDFIRNCIYRQDLLNIFSMEEFDDSTINEQIAQLHVQIKFYSALNDCMTCLANSINTADSLLGLMVLFSFDYLFLIHPYICEYLDNGFISDTNLIQMKQRITV